MFRTENPLSSGWEGWQKHRQNLGEFLDLKEISPELMFNFKIYGYVPKLGSSNARKNGVEEGWGHGEGLLHPQNMC